MPRVPGSRDRSALTPPLAAIADRVQERVVAAGLAFDRRAGATRPKTRPTREQRVPTLQRAMSPDPVTARERASLGMVFLELGEAHRRYRIRTGNPGTPALRAAAHAFKQAPSITSLVPVAAFLDELGILAW